MAESLKPINTLNWQRSLEFVLNHNLLSPAGCQLAGNVIRLGRVFPLRTEGGEVMILDVKHFLNHRVDTGLMMAIGEELAGKLSDLNPEFVLTAPSSGISPAFAVAIHLGNIPLIYTQKNPPITFNDGPILSTDSFSYTTNREEPMTAAGTCIPSGQRGVAIDDFLDTGRKSTNLVEITQQAGSELVGFGYAIEKSGVGGRKKVNSAGISIINSVLDIAQMEPGRIQIEGLPYWLSLKNNGQPNMT